VALTGAAGTDIFFIPEVVSPQPTLAAVIEGRDRGIKEWRLQRWAGMGQEMLWGPRPRENGETSDAYME
jgi:hypothetical protein